LVVSRLVPHKRVDLAIETATRFKIPLKVIGGGRELARLRAMAGPTVEFLGFAPRPVVIDHLQRCKALILPGVEDFGMTSVEAQAAGRPVIAIDRGGARESVVNGESGVLFDEQTPESLFAAMVRLDRLQISAEACARSAQRFDEAVFRAGMMLAVERARQAAGH
jgi:glycosyltransferase involved in cell wall biosynthesis